MTSGIARQRVLILDFGSQYAQLIARRVREQNVYCEIVRLDISVERIRSHAPQGLILSGGPKSVYEEDSPRCDPEIFSMAFPCWEYVMECSLHVWHLVAKLIARHHVNMAGLTYA